MNEIQDLANHHQPISDVFKMPNSKEEWNQYRLSDEQVAHFHEYGYVSGIKLLDERQIEVLQKELAEIVDPKHPSHSLFYEFHSNESEDSNSVLFHSLGHWRITKGFHDALWNPAFVMLLINYWRTNLFAFGTTNYFVNQPNTAEWSLGIKIIRIGHEQLPCNISPVGQALMTHRPKMGVYIIFLKVINGDC